MRATRLPLVREHTGDPAQERTQREGRAVAAQVNALLARVEDLTARIVFLESYGMPLGRKGYIARAMGNANQTLTAEEAKRWLLQPTGALTAVRTLTVPIVPLISDETVLRVFQSGTTGGFGVNVTNGVGAPVLLADGTSRLIGFYEGGAFAIGGAL